VPLNDVAEGAFHKRERLRRSGVCLPRALPRPAEAVASAATSGGASTAPSAAVSVRRARGAAAAASTRHRAEAHWSCAIRAWHVVSLPGRGDMESAPVNYEHMLIIYPGFLKASPRSAEAEYLLEWQPLVGRG
jgi:hypothetical protein